MPFTIAHPVAVLPLLRPLKARAVTSALVIGSLAPDFIYWVPVRLPRLSTHTLPALLWFCLPIGLGAFALYHAGLKRSLLELLPEAWARPLRPLAQKRLKDYRALNVAVGVVLGGATHVALDACTHLDGLVTRLLPVLREPIGLNLPGVPLHGYQVLQYSLSLSGIAILAIWIWRSMQRLALSVDGAHHCDRGSDRLTDSKRTAIRSAVWILAGLWAAQSAYRATANVVDPWYAFRLAGTQYAIHFIAAAVVLLVGWCGLWALGVSNPEKVG